MAHSPFTSEVCGSNPRPYVGMLVCIGLYVLVSSVHATTRRDMAYTVLQAMLKPRWTKSKQMAQSKAKAIMIIFKRNF